MKKYIVLLISTLIVIAIFSLTLNDQKVDVIEYSEVVEEVKEKTIDLDSYHDVLSQIADDNDVYGMQVVAFKNNEIIDSYNYGYSDIKSKTIVNDDTVFRLASTSKLISNMLIMKLVDEGKLDLDANLKEVTGLDFDERATLTQLLTHTSGINDPYVFENNLDKVYDVNYLLKKAQVNIPGEVYNYSNFGAGLMAAIIESITNERFYDYAQRELFDYLDLNAAYLCEYLDENTKIAKMYDDEVYDPATWEFNKDFYSRFELGKQYRLAYGNMYSSSSDLAKLGMVLAGNGYYQDKYVLSRYILNQTRVVKDEAEGHLYLMCLNTDLYQDLVEGRNLYGHTGSAYNAYTYLIYDPDDQSGVAFTCNHTLIKRNDLKYPKIFYDTVNVAYQYVLGD